MFRLLALLQLTRAALAFTAIADAWTVMLLYTYPTEVPIQFYHGYLLLGLKMALVSIISAGLYGFGMTLNDLMDARRDRIFAPRRPIPSGRIHPRTAIVVALTLLMLSLLAAAIIGVLDAALFHDPFFIPWSFFVALVTAILIMFYDSAAKYLGGIGLLTLGLIRAFHCLVGNPTTPILVLSMVLLTHTTLISLIAYKLENKRPRLKAQDWIIAGIGLVLGNSVALLLMFIRQELTPRLLPLLIGPLIAMFAYAAWAFIDLVIVHGNTLTTRQKGGRLMLMGLFWLFIYDASALFANGQWKASLAVAGLLVCAIISFFAIRFLSRYLSITKPHYRIERATH